MQKDEEDMPANLKLIQPEVTVPKQIDSLIGQYREMDDKIEAIKEMHKAQLQPFVEAQEKAKGRLLKWLTENGLKSARTSAGTITILHQVSATLGDGDAFMQFVIENHRFEMLDRRVNKTACREYVEENGGPPPGINYSVVANLSVRKPA